ncbi:hypothetical protein GUJ93_ZPchr0002g23904 [Zizania palustris]|uniref:Uncharacterized protein n=1 Tax=Zizania palustris TaxID=103762 RepID=A0A8J5RUG7_ZIZPA|nr:hypothetical protein GUJ93_ZPchr0002g23904 [Zizania palustris]
MGRNTGARDGTHCPALSPSLLRTSTPSGESRGHGSAFYPGFRPHHPRRWRCTLALVTARAAGRPAASLPRRPRAVRGNAEVARRKGDSQAATYCGAARSGCSAKCSCVSPRAATTVAAEELVREDAHQAGAGGPMLRERVL